MKIRIVIMTVMCIFLTRCATYYNMFNLDIPTSTYYTKEERDLLVKTTKSINFDYGYNPNLDLDYVFPLTGGYTEFKAGDKDLAKVLENVDTGTLIAFSEKIYCLKRITAIRMDLYWKNGEWNNYTLFYKYLQPPIDFYSSMLEKQAMKRDKGYMLNIENRKKSLDKKSEYEVYWKEFLKIWKNDYDS